MKTITIFLILTTVAALWLTCRGQQAPTLTSGIEGQVLIEPTCPVLREGTPCPDQPYQATIAVWNAERTEKVRTFTTDEDGRFRAPLAPGEYYIDPQPPNPGAPPTPITQTVTIPPDRFVQITIEYDSGIR